MVPRVEMYIRPWCPYCHRAKALLDARGVSYELIDLDVEPARESEMLARADGRTTVPEIFIDGRLIGGSDELAALAASGGLDALLDGPAAEE